MKLLLLISFSERGYGGVGGVKGWTLELTNNDVVFVFVLVWFFCSKNLIQSEQSLTVIMATNALSFCMDNLSWVGFLPLNLHLLFYVKIFSLFFESRI